MNVKSYYIQLPYATFGIDTIDDIVRRAPPIAHWAIGKTITELTKWIKSKGGAIDEIT